MQLDALYHLEFGAHYKGGSKRGVPGGHICHSLVGIVKHFLQVLQGEHGHSPSTGCSPVTKFPWFYSVK